MESAREKNLGGAYQKGVRRRLFQWQAQEEQSRSSGAFRGRLLLGSLVWHKKQSQELPPDSEND